MKTFGPASSQNCIAGVCDHSGWLSWPHLCTLLCNKRPDENGLHDFPWAYMFHNRMLVMVFLDAKVPFHPSEQIVAVFTFITIFFIFRHVYSCETLISLVAPSFLHHKVFSIYVWLVCDLYDVSYSEVTLDHLLTCPLEPAHRGWPEVVRLQLPSASAGITNGIDGRSCRPAKLFCPVLSHIWLLFDF